jgi:hypothetical protein
MGRIPWPKAWRFYQSVSALELRPTTLLDIRYGFQARNWSAPSKATLMRSSGLV